MTGMQRLSITWERWFYACQCNAPLNFQSDIVQICTQQRRSKTYPLDSTASSFLSRALCYHLHLFMTYLRHDHRTSFCVPSLCKNCMPTYPHCKPNGYELHTHVLNKFMTIFIRCWEKRGIFLKCVYDQI